MFIEQPTTCAKSAYSNYVEAGLGGTVAFDTVQDTIGRRYGNSN